MPVRVLCPHCQTPCQVAEQHVGMPVRCGRCARTFTTRPSAQGHGRETVPQRTETLPRRTETGPGLDIGGAASEASPQTDCFLVRHLVWTHLDERHELGVLVIADRPLVHTVCVALAPLLSGSLGGTRREAAGVPDVIAHVLGKTNPPDANAAVVVAWDGQLYIGRTGGCKVWHYHAGQMTAIAERSTERSIAPGAWVAATSEASPAKLDPMALPEEMAKAPCAARLAQAWAERGGILVVALRALPFD